MTWFRLDDQCAFGAKVLKAGDEAFGMWCRAGCWSSGALTDGFIPAHIATKLGRKSLWIRLETCGETDQKGLVERAENGWQIHDFLDWNPTASSVKQRREKTKEKVAAWRENKARRNPVSNQVTDSTCNPVSNLSPVPSRPVPSPLPSVEDLPASAPRPAATPPDLERVFGVWKATLMPAAKQTEQRMRRIKARFKEGFTTDQLCKAVIGASKDPFLMGTDPNSRRGGYRDIETVFRDAAQVERLVRLADGVDPPPPPKINGSPCAQEPYRAPPPEPGVSKAMARSAEIDRLCASELDKNGLLASRALRTRLESGR